MTKIINKTRLAKAQKQERKLSLRIKEAFEAGELEKAHLHTHKYLTSYDAKLVAAYESYRDIKRPKPKNVNILHLAEQVNPWEGCDEIVQMRIQPKGPDKQEGRGVLKFGLQRRVMQNLVAGALKPQAGLHSNQYSQNGGISAAGIAVLNALMDGYTAVVSTDINSCFNSFNEEEVHKLLPLPGQIVENVVLGRTLPIDLPGYTSHLGEGGLYLNADTADMACPCGEVIVLARRGIPQGSCCSPLIADMLLAPIVHALPNGARVIVYADNFLILGRTEAEADTMKQALWTAFKGHPAGPLVPRIEHEGNAHDGFSFLGYTFRRQGSVYVAVPTDANRHKARSTLDSIVSRMMNKSLIPERRREAYVRARKFVKSWAAAFSLWDGAPDWRAERLAFVKNVWCQTQ